MLLVREKLTNRVSNVVELFKILEIKPKSSNYDPFTPKEICFHLEWISNSNLSDYLYYVHMS